MYLYISKASPRTVLRCHGRQPTDLPRFSGTELCWARHLPHRFSHRLACRAIHRLFAPPKRGKSHMAPSHYSTLRRGHF